MSGMKTSGKLIPVIIILASIAGIIFTLYGHFFAGTALPSAEPYSIRPSVSNAPTGTSVPMQEKLPAEVNLAIPFTSQAPYQNWGQPYEDFCEEASVLMAIQFVRGQDIPDAEFADRQLLAIRNFELGEFGDYKDTNAQQTSVILKKFFGYPNVKLVSNPTVADIKNYVAQHKAVLVPAAGQELPNPYFKQPGPPYHMVVIKGYTADGKFITNDPGTRRGADFMYTYGAIMNAMHDWNGGDVEHGAKVIIVVG